MKDMALDGASHELSFKIRPPAVSAQATRTLKESKNCQKACGFPQARWQELSTVTKQAARVTAGRSFPFAAWQNTPQPTPDNWTFAEQFQDIVDRIIGCTRGLIGKFLRKVMYTCGDNVRGYDDDDEIDTCNRSFVL
jgi:hypothetical protein